jgi:hypothetical protein
MSNRRNIKSTGDMCISIGLMEKGRLYKQSSKVVKITHTPGETYGCIESRSKLHKLALVVVGLPILVMINYVLMRIIKHRRVHRRV